MPHFVGHAYQDKDTKDEFFNVRCDGCNRRKYRFDVWSDENGGNTKVVCNKECWYKAMEKEAENAKRSQN